MKKVWKIGKNIKFDKWIDVQKYLDLTGQKIVSSSSTYTKTKETTILHLAKNS